MEKSGKAFVEHWDWAAEKGLMKKNSARALGAASKQVLSVDENWETKDVSTIDVEGLLRRFKNLRSKEFKPQTLAAYERRFKRALDLFLEYTRDPANWKPPVGRRGHSRKTKTVNHQPNEIVEGPTYSVEADHDGSASIQNLIEYPFPLRKDCVVSLRLPSDLKVSDVERLAAFMRTLVLDFDAST